MKRVKLVVLSLFAAVLFTLPALMASSVEGQAITDAPTGFDDLTNGFTDQATFDADKDVFAEFEDEGDGLGPIFNAASCGDCHVHPVIGAISQITEERAGHFNGVNFIDHPGGSLIGSRATDVAIQEHVLDGNEVRAFRTSLNTLGDGFVEAIDSNDLLANGNNEVFVSGGRITPRLIQVPVNEAGNQIRAGRFGWKDQHASLESFSADAYLNEMGITSPLQPVENTSNGLFVGFGSGFDPVPEPEDNGEDVEIFARFMRATKAPPRGAITAAANAGQNVFNAIGCAICHTPSFVTVPPGTVINQGAFTVPAALGNKRIRPFSDFLLHNVGTGDGIVQNGGQVTRNELRTPPLWGVRARNRLMHDGESLTFNDAILRHDGEANFVINNYRALSTANKNNLIAFLRSL